jgi:hypothetical protein
MDARRSVYEQPVRILADPLEALGEPQLRGRVQMGQFVDAAAGGNDPDAGAARYGGLQNHLLHHFFALQDLLQGVLG